MHLFIENYVFCERKIVFGLKQFWCTQGDQEMVAFEQINSKNIIIILCFVRVSFGTSYCKWIFQMRPHKAIIEPDYSENLRFSNNKTY